MPLSLRMNPLLEKELELAAKMRGISKSQFIVDAVERALGRKNPYELMVALKAQEQAEDPSDAAFAERQRPYETKASRKQLVSKLKAKRASSAR